MNPRHGWLLFLAACATEPTLTDADGDGFAAGQDCDDTDPRVAVGPEIPYDGLDNDCDATTADDDLDGDGVLFADDCDDLDPAAQDDGTWEGDLDQDEPAPCDGTCELTVAGDLRHELGTDTDLQRYRCVVSAQNVSLADPSLTSLRGLDQLTTVEGTLALGYLDGVRSLEGLGGLVTVGELFGVAFSGLTTLSGLQGPVQVGALHVQSNADLEALGALRVLGGLTVVDNPSLLDLSALSVPADAGPVTIEDNAALPSLAGLEDLRRIDGDLVLRDNDGLKDLTALHGLEEVTGDVVIRGNRNLPDGAETDLVEAIGTIGGTVDLDPVRGG